MIEHIVFLKFKPETTRAQKEEAIKRLHELKHKVSGIVDLQANFNFADLSKGYEVGLTVRFESMDVFEQYGPSPEHQECLAFLNKIGIEDKIIVDFEI